MSCLTETLSQLTCTASLHPLALYVRRALSVWPQHLQL